MTARHTHIPTPPAQKPRDLLVVCHGSRSAGWIAAQQAWFAQLCDLLPANIAPQLTFLEIADPLFARGLEEHANHHADRPLWVFPFFLSRSGHAGEEIP